VEGEFGSVGLTVGQAMVELAEHAVEQLAQRGEAAVAGGPTGPVLAEATNCGARTAGTAVKRR
jgi:hypothetical protein